MQMVAEGVETCRSVHQLFEPPQNRNPISSARLPYSISKNRDPVKETYDLMSRDMKAEDE